MSSSAKCMQDMMDIMINVSEEAPEFDRAPIANIFECVTQNVSEEFQKEISFVINGGKTELEGSVMSNILYPIAELVRNSIEHGIESPLERSKLGKTEAGIVTLNAYHEAGTFVVEVSDDGKGLNPDDILLIARDIGLVQPEQILSEEEIYNLILEPEFLNKNTTAVSEQDVGMNFVRRSIESLHGCVCINSEINKGVKITLRLPLKFSKIEGLHFCIEDESFILPANIIKESIHLNQLQTEEIILNDSICYNDEALHVINLSKYLGTQLEEKGLFEYNLVIVEMNNRVVGLLIKKIYCETYTVIKHLGQTYHKSSFFMGFSILESGKLALIIDVHNIIKSSIKRKNTWH